MAKNGEIHFKTDNAPLFEWSLEEFEACGLEIKNLTRDLHADEPVGIMTGYEEKFYELGTPINRCELVNHKERRFMTKIPMSVPLVEMDGDEMTRVLWKQIKDELLLPYVDPRKPNITISVCQSATARTIRSRRRPPRRSKNTAWASSAPPSRPTPSA